MFELIILWIVWVSIGSIWYLNKESEYHRTVKQLDERIDEFNRLQRLENMRNMKNLTKGKLLKSNLIKKKEPNDILDRLIRR